MIIFSYYFMTYGINKYMTIMAIFINDYDTSLIGVKVEQQRRKYAK